MKKIIAVIALCLMSTPAFAIQLAKYKVEGKVGQTVTADLVNNENQPITVKVVVVPEIVKPVPADAGDCSKSLRVFPKLFTLKEGDAQVVKLLSRKPGYCRVYFETDKVKPDMVLEGEGGVKVDVRFRTGIPAVITE